MDCGKPADHGGTDEGDEGTTVAFDVAGDARVTVVPGEGALDQIITFRDAATSEPESRWPSGGSMILSGSAGGPS